MELLGVGALGICSLDGGGLDDLNATATDAMSTSHFLVQLCHGTVQSGVTVLFVCIVDPGTGVITDPDAKILDGSGIAFANLVGGKDLTVGFLDTSKFSEEIPEFRLGFDVILGPQFHSVDLWVRFFIGGQVASHNLVLTILILQGR